MAGSLDIGNAKSLLGDYYQEFREDVTLELQERLFDTNSRTSLANQMEFIEMGNVTEAPLTDLSSSEVLQPADADNFTPTSNAVRIKARKLITYGVKVDLSFTPQELDQIYFAAKKKNRGATTNVQTLTDLAFGEYFMSVIMDRVQADAKKLAIKGDLTLPSGMLSAIDGEEAIIANEVTAGNITVVTPSGSTVIEKLESVFDALGDEYQEDPNTVAKVSKSLFNSLVRANQATLGRKWNYTNDLNNEIEIDGYPCKIVRNNHYAAGKVIITSKSNLVLGMSSMEQFNSFQFQQDKRKLIVLGDMRLGVQIRSARTTNRPVVTATIS